jgi:hypothetical protein
MVASMKMAVFLVVAPCSLEEGYRHFRGAGCTLLLDYTAQQLRRQPPSLEELICICEPLYTLQAK